MSSGEKTLLEKASEGVSGIGQAVSGAAETASNAYSGAKESVSSTLNDFSSKNVINASTGFLNSNGMIAKFFFLILVLGAFIFFFYLGMQIIGFFVGGATSVYVVSGLIPDMKAYSVVIKTDYTQPKTLTNIPIMRSNNQLSGLEFTWCCWLNLKPVKRDSTTTSEKYGCIFVKGSGASTDTVYGKLDGSANVSTTNCPGLYLYNDYYTIPGGINTASPPITNTICIMIDTVTSNISDLNANVASANTQIIDISNIPINKWFHIAIRCQNKSIDVYINGTIYVRSVLSQPPRQNSDSIHIADSLPPGGAISDLRYFNYALSIIDINGIVNAGPNLKLYKGYASSSANQTGQFSNASYLANSWYNKY